MSYYAKMMNVQMPANWALGFEGCKQAWQWGHREARYACANEAREADAEIATLRARVAELQGIARACLTVVLHREVSEAVSGNPPEAARWRALADRIYAAIAPKEAQ